MDTWNRLAGAQGEGDERDWIKNVKGLAKEHICIPHGYGQ